ncbi:MAG: VWA domain-containing protein [Candidatus Aenigmarchaeota archaeon]|nr:VWA domain-containing protein [Candidatus Aenigmarchaeota archaeon]
MESFLEKTKNTINGDKLDELKFKDIYKQISPEVTKHIDKLKTVEKLAEDVWRELYKYSPELINQEKIESAYQFNRTLTEKCKGLKEFDMLRTYTQLDDLSSTVATCTLIEKLLQSIPPQELDKINEDIERCMNHQNNLQHLQDQMEGTQALTQSNPKDKQLQQQLQNVKQQAQTTSQQLQQASQDLQGNITKNSPAIRSAMRQALNQAAEETKETHDFMMGWGIEPGSLQQMPYEDKIELARKIRNSPVLRQVSKIVGRMKLLLASKQKQKITKVPEEIVDISQGDDIMRTVPSDMMLMMDEDTEPLFIRKFTEKQLQTYELEGKEKQGEGPIIVCVDNSGSMSGEPEIVSKAIAYALLDLASKKKRRFACIHFGAENEYEVFEITPDMKGDERIKTIISMLSYFRGGGTCYETPLEQTIKIMEKDEYRRGGCIFISDGECDISDKFLEQYKKVKKDKDFRCIGILVGFGGLVMRKFCDIVITTDALTTDDVKVAEQLFEAI